jgi:CrcB protein
MNLFFISIFGVLGVLARYLINLLLAQKFASFFFLGTFSINTLGSFLIGLVYAFGIEKAGLSPAIAMGVMVGFLGGFTTFSTYCLEVNVLLEQGRYGLAAAYFSLSPIVGTLAAIAGLRLGRFF